MRFDEFLGLLTKLRTSYYLLFFHLSLCLHKFSFFFSTCWFKYDIIVIATVDLMCDLGNGSYTWWNNKRDKTCGSDNMKGLFKVLLTIMRLAKHEREVFVYLD